MLQPVRRRTWSPCGQTPREKSSARHDRLSSISALTLAPQRKRVGLYFQFQRRNIRWQNVFRFLEKITQTLRRPIILVLDRWNVHKSAVRRLVKMSPRRIEIEWLPPYAPQLNPVEYIWTNTKYARLANFVPNDIDHLHVRARAALQRTKSSFHLLRSAFKHAKLTLDAH